MRIYQIYKFVRLRFYARICHFVTSLYFKLNNIEINKFTSIGVPLIEIERGGHFEFGDGFIMVNNAKFAPLGRSNRCKIVVLSKGRLIMGHKIGMSNVTIVAATSVVLGNNVLLGGGTTIVDTDFHSLNPADWFSDDDSRNMKSDAVVIGDNVFIGMNTIILKGVNIGSDAVVAAGSVVVKNIPKNEIWGGNPAKFIRSNLIGRR